MRKPVFSLVLSVLCLLAALPAGGAERGGAPAGDPGSLPIEVTADRLDADSRMDSVTFQGNVTAVQGDVTLFADRLYAEYSRSSRAIETITAEGNVRMMQGDRRARAPRAVFHNLEQRIVLSGGVELIQGENTLRGDTVTIDLRENRSVLTGGEGGRVRAIINPRGLSEEPGKEGR
jgi:lipopolysaccharide export system protein LptA